MATVKSFTSLEQSKVLATILSLESADMCYKCIEDDPYDIVCKPYSEWKEEYKGLLVRGDANVIPCWSLAALLDILPEGTRLLKSTNISYVGDTKYHCDCPKGNIDEWFNNPIDAAYAMIIKLKERNLL